MVTLKTDRLILRPFEAGDRDALFAVFSHPEAMKYWSTPPHASPEETAQMIAGSMAADPATHQEFVILLEGEVIGKAGLWQVPEIGYILHPDYWRKGIATEAIGAVLDHAFGTMGLDRVVADVDPDNTGSIRSLEKLGFRETGREEKTIEINGVWYDSIYFALTRADWGQARGGDEKGPPG